MRVNKLKYFNDCLNTARTALSMPNKNKAEQIVRFALLKTIQNPKKTPFFKETDYLFFSDKQKTFVYPQKTAGQTCIYL